MELGEGDGDLMKMLMQTDPPDESIQGPMEDSAMGYPQTGMAYGSGHYGGMQQQLPTMHPQQQQQPRVSSFPSMSPGQMNPRSPNNGMMQQDLDLVLQQQQYQQQQQQQSAYGNGNYQGYKGGYRGPTPVSPQTHTQPMGPYQGGFPSEPGYPQGAGTNQGMGEFGPQAGPNQSMGMPGPASLSLANLSARQQFYSDGYGMNPPVSPVQKQMQQSGGFLPPSGIPYSQQVQPYQSSSYPKRPSPSSVQSQVQGFNAGGTFTSRSSAGMQMPNMPYQSPTSPYQPPHSPVMRSTTSPVPQQDVVLYSMPRESFPQPRSPFGPSQGQFQQQQQQHSSCMFVQPGTTPLQSQYQSQQQMVGDKSGGLTQRRASYPGQQSTIKMPSPPLKRSPPSSLPNPKSPDLSRGNPLGFDERGSFKAVSKKEKSSSPPCIDPSQAVSASNMKETLSNKVSDGHKGLPRQRRSTSDAQTPSVSPPAIKKEGIDGNKAEVMGGKMKDNIKKNDHERNAAEPRKSNGTPQGEGAGHSLKKQAGNKGDKSFPSSSDYKGNSSCSSVTAENIQTAVAMTKPENVTPVPEEPPSKAQQVIDKTKERCKEIEDTASDGEKSTSQTKASIAESQETKTAAAESVELDRKDGIAREKTMKGKALSSSENENDKENETTTSKTDQKSTNNICEMTSAGKSEAADHKSGRDSDCTDKTCSKTAKVEDGLSKPVSETCKPSDETYIQSEKNMSETGNTGQAIERADKEPVKTSEEAGQSGHTKVETNPGTADKTVDSVGNRDASEDKQKNKDGKTDTVQTESKRAEEQREAPKKSIIKAKPSSDREASTTEPNLESSKVAKKKPLLKIFYSESTSKAEVQKKPAMVSLRCEERLSSDDDDHSPVSKEVPLAPPVESRTLGIQTTEQTTATPRASHQRATSIKATIIAKGKSAQSNQQVMVAKTTSGQMYLIQGNILVPVQSVTSKDDSASKMNSKVIIVNPLKTATGQVGGIKLLQSATAAMGFDVKADAKNSKATEESRSSVANKKSDDSLRKLERSPNAKSDTKSGDKPSASKGSKMPLVHPEKGTNILGKEKLSNKTETPMGQDLKNSADNQEKTSSPSKQATWTEEDQNPTLKTTGRGRPPGSKDKQKRKSFVHKSKQTQDEMAAEVNTEEHASNRKFSKTASVVQEMASSSIEPSITSKRPLALDVPTVNASKSPKRRKISSSGSPVKHISVKPRGGLDGDSWVCSLCGKRSSCNLLGDLYGPYKTKFSREKTDSSSSKDGKLSQKLSSPGRKSSSDTHVDRKPSSNEDDVESCDVDLWIHRDCGVWSPGVFMLGRTIHGLEQAVESAAQHKCTECSEVGATLVCFKRGCNKMFHYACARDSGCSFIEDNFTIFCSTHK